MTAAKDINLQSRAGGIEVVALEDVKFRALDGSVSMIGGELTSAARSTATPHLSCSLSLVAAFGVLQDPYAQPAHCPTPHLGHCPEPGSHASRLPAVRLLQRQALPGGAALHLRGRRLHGLQMIARRQALHVRRPRRDWRGRALLGSIVELFIR